MSPLPPPVIKIIERPSPIQVVEVPVAAQPSKKPPSLLVTADSPALLLKKPGRMPSKLSIVHVVDEANLSTSATRLPGQSDDPSVKESTFLVVQPNVIQHEAPHLPDVTHAKQVRISDRQRKRHRIKEAMHRLLLMFGLKNHKRSHRHYHVAENHLKPRKRDRARAKVPRRFWYILIGRERTIIAMPLFQNAARMSGNFKAQKKHRAAMNRGKPIHTRHDYGWDNDRPRGRQVRDTSSEQRNEESHRSPHTQQNVGRKMKSDIRQVTRDARVAKNDVIFHTTTGTQTRNRYLKI